MWMITIQETFQIGGRIRESSSMSINHLLSGTVNSRTHFRLKFLDQILLLFIIATDMIELLMWKLRCFGIPSEGLAEVFCDNISVVDN